MGISPEVSASDDLLLPLVDRLRPVRPLCVGYSIQQLACDQDDEANSQLGTDSELELPSRLLV
jgi:hypothetical protein